MIPAEGLNYSLNAAYKGAAQVATWYVGLLTDYVPVSTDTNATIAAHEITAYTVAGQSVTRGAWVPGAVTGGQLTSAASPVVITFTAPVTVFGAFLSSTATKGAGTSGVLASLDRFTASRSFLAGETLDVSAIINSAGV